MTRDRLDRLRESVRLFRKAVDRHNMLVAALRDAETARIVRSRDLADELARAGIPDGEAFEHAGLVFWREGDSTVTLNHVYLAFYR